MNCKDPKRAAELGLQHAGLLAQMTALVDNANRAGRELSGSELLQHDRLASDAAKVLSDLRAIDPLAAKVANGNAPMRRTELLADLNAIDPPSSGDTEDVERQVPRGDDRPPSYNGMLQRIQAGVLDDRKRRR